MSTPKHSKTLSALTLVHLIRHLICKSLSTFAPITLGGGDVGYQSQYNTLGYNYDCQARITEDWIRPNTVAPGYVFPTNRVYLKYQYNKSLDEGASISMDQYYGALAGRVLPCLKDIAPPMRGMTHYPGLEPLEQKPVNIDENETYCFPLYVNEQWSSTPTTFDCPQYAQLQMPHNDPLQYRSHSLNLSMFAARFGAVNYSDAQIGYSGMFKSLIYPHLSNAETAKFSTGLNYTRYIESSNEQDRNWIAADAAAMALPPNDPNRKKTRYRMWPDEYAAQLSADYDGHCQSADFQVKKGLLPGMSNNTAVIWGEGSPTAYLGVKNIDPSIQLVMGGLADLRGKYVEEMVDWCQANRSGCSSMLPFDVVNVHHYSTKKSKETPIWDIYNNHDKSYFSGTNDAASPEEDKLLAKLRYFKARLESYDAALQEKKIWLTEFGYDVDGTSPTRVPVILGQSQQKTQAQWLTRGLLEIAASKAIDRCDIFEIRDDLGGGTSTFNTSGLLNRFLQPKESYYYVQTVKNLLKDYEYAGVENYSLPSNPNPPFWNSSAASTLFEIPDDNGILMENHPATLDFLEQKTRIYRFHNATNPNQDIFAIWSPTALGFNLNPPGSTYNVTFNIKAELLNGASILELRNLDEDGVWTNFTSNTEVISTNPHICRITNLPVSETPIFLVLNKQMTSVATPPVQNLTAAPVCCSEFLLQWTIPAGANYASYKIYYSDAALPGAGPNFNLSTATLYAENISGTLNEVLVTGTLANVNYRFWVIPVSADGNVPNVLTSNVTMTNPGCNTPNPCIYNIQANSTMTLGNGSQSVVNAGDINNVLSVSGGCDILQQNDYGGGWDNWDWTNHIASQTTVTLTLNPGTKLDIKAFYINDGYGTGNLRIEYQYCGQTPWLHFADVNTKDTKKWHRIPANLPNVTAIRFWKLDSSARIAKFMICGAPSATSCRFSGDVKPTGTEVTVNNLQVRSADLEWKAMQYNERFPEQGNVSLYTIAYTPISNKDGKLPEDYKVVEVSADRFSTQVSYPLRELMPGTLYMGKMINGQMDKEQLIKESTPLTYTMEDEGSKFYTRLHPFYFTTLPSPVDEKFTAGQNEVIVHSDWAAKELFVFPNPVMIGRDQLQIEMPSGGFTRVELIENSTGRTLITQQVSETDGRSAMKLDGSFNAGSYTLRAFHKNGEVYIGRLTVVKD